MTFPGFLSRFSTLAFIVLLGCSGEPSDAGSDDDGSLGGAGSGAGGAPTSGQGPDGPWIQMPIEVLGSGAPDEPVVESRELPLAAGVDPSDVTRLFVRCHRCGFYDSPEFQKLDAPLTRVKASVRVGGEGDFVDVTEENVELDPVSRAHGGFDGGLVTTTFHLVLDASTRARLVASPGANQIEFRFNGTDGNSNGFRILSVELQDDAGTNLSPVEVRFADVGEEKSAAAPSTADVEAGRALWHGHGILVKSPVVHAKLRAACSSCHAEDGRDLQYFNYSNRSIVERSRFHGLSADEGAQIVAYLRSSLYDAVPHVAAAAPWNPPYQPGPGLDERPSVEWAAGAGLDAVLPDGATFLREFVGRDPNDSSPLGQAELDAAHSVDPALPLNTRHMRVPLQFPDWNAWLPITHPLDVWTPDEGEEAGLFETKSPDTENPQKVFERVRDWLLEHENPNGVYGDWSHLTPDERQQMHSWFNDLGGKSIAFGGGGRGTRESGDAENPWGGEIGAEKALALLDDDTRALAEGAAVNGFSKQAFIERSLFGLFHWLGVKQWELAHRFGLEGPQPHFRGKKDASGAWIGEGEVRGWPYSWPSVFYVAPHMIYAPEQTTSGLREFYFSWEPRLVSYYRTNQWYQLQMTLNPGWAGASSGPMDWPYHMGFTTAVADDLIAAEAPDWIPAAHLARYFQVKVKLAQLANTDLPFDEPHPDEPENLFRNTGMNSRADLLFKLGVAEITHRGANDWQRTKFEKLEAIEPGLHAKFVNAALTLFDAYYGDTTADMYRRCDPEARMFGDEGEFESKSGQRFCLDAARTPLPIDENGEPYLPGGWVDWTTEQHITWGTHAAEDLGCDPARIQAVRDWLDSIYE